MFPLFDISFASYYGNFFWGASCCDANSGGTSCPGELLAKKRRSVKHKAQDPPESNLSAQGKVLKLGVSDPRSRSQVQVKGQALSSSVGVFEVVGA